MHPLEVTEVIQGRRYSTVTAMLIAGDDYWDGHNFERRGTNTFLYRTPKGNYFTHNRTQWQGAADGTISPIGQDEALELWEGLRERRVSFEEAFPDVAVIDA